MDINDIRKMDYDIEDFFNEVEANDLLEELNEVEIHTFIYGYLLDETVLEMYERYRSENGYYESIFYPIHSMEDHFGYMVQEFLENNTDIPNKYAYYRIDNSVDNKVQWFTEEEAIDIARYNLEEMNISDLMDYYQKS